MNKAEFDFEVRKLFDLKLKIEDQANSAQKEEEKKDTASKEIIHLRREFNRKINDFINKHGQFQEIVGFCYSMLTSRTKEITCSECNLVFYDLNYLRRSCHNALECSNCFKESKLSHGCTEEESELPFDTVTNETLVEIEVLRRMHIGMISCFLNRDFKKRRRN